jgi:asparagine synthase (glutamine-hydrolysing)
LEKKSVLKHVNECKGTNLAFGFRRLSIVDLSSAGHQPMTEFSRRFWIVFNGEIFNHNELRSELRLKGFVFKTDSDTEVILNAYRYWGKDCVSKFNGMWAFAILDSSTGSVFISRDRFGIKPLYLHHIKGKHFAFASEIKPLLAMFGGTICSSTVADYLFKGTSNHTESTFWNEIHLFPKGCSAFFVDGELKTEPYYRLSDERFQGTFDEACITFRTLLTDSIRLRQRSDVQLGFALSGGLDSSSLLGLSRKTIPNDRVVSYSMVFPGDVADESRFIDAVNDFNNMQFQKFTFRSEDLLQDLDAFCLSQEQPFGGLSYYGEFKLKECMHNAGVVVSIEGQGADEIISGYSNLLPYYFADLMAEGKWVDFLSRARQFGISLKTALKSASIVIYEKSLGGKQTYNLSKYPSFDPIYYSISDSTKKGNDQSRGFLQDELKQQLLFTSLPEQLVKADKSAMQFSIEARFPFLDYRLVDFTATLPFYFKIHHVSKHILRESLRDALPPIIRNRRDKIGFAVPVEKMLSDQLFQYMRTRIAESNLPGFNSERFQEEFGTKESINWKYWKVASLILWQQVFDSYRINNAITITEQS